MYDIGYMNVFAATAMNENEEMNERSPATLY